MLENISSLRHPYNTVLLALGSNLGDRLGNLVQGARLLARGGVEVHAISSVYETPPLGYLLQPPFLNLVLRGSTALEPFLLLERFREAEAAAGRERTVRDGPRTLDIDLILYGTRIVRAPGLRVPHPRWKGRSFVVVPLAEVAPGAVDPESGLSAREVARLWPQEPHRIHRVGDPPVLGPAPMQGSP